MDRNDRVCAVCGTTYKFCNRCQEDKDKPLWFYTFHSENCKNIYEIASAFEDGKLAAKDAKESLDKLDLSLIENFGNSYKSTISKINEEVKASENVKIVKKYEAKKFTKNDDVVEEKHVVSDDVE